MHTAPRLYRCLALIALALSVSPALAGNEIETDLHLAAGNSFTVPIPLRRAGELEVRVDFEHDRDTTVRVMVAGPCRDGSILIVATGEDQGDDGSIELEGRVAPADLAQLLSLDLIVFTTQGAELEIEIEHP